jgi:ribose 1,5-bisphosphokinase PhnN
MTIRWSNRPFAAKLCPGLWPKRYRAGIVLSLTSAANGNRVGWGMGCRVLSHLAKKESLRLTMSTMTSRARGAERLRQRRARREARFVAPGRLLLVVDAHDGTPAVVFSAVRRRCAAHPDLAFARRLTTRLEGSSDHEHSITRRAFRDTDRADGFLATWDVRGHRFGLPAALRDLLMAGRTVVAAAPASIVPDIRAQWPDVRIIRVMAELDAARSRLEPRLCLARMTGMERTGVAAGLRVDVNISCANDPGTAVRLLTEALLRLRAHQVPRGSPERACPESRLASSAP